jgi:hypothetical protein
MKKGVEQCCPKRELELSLSTVDFERNRNLSRRWYRRPPHKPCLRHVEALLNDNDSMLGIGFILPALNCRYHVRISIG